MPNAKLSSEWLLDMRKKIMLSFVSDDDLLERLVLKGGNALELIYKITKRPSMDIDFSMADDFAENEVPEVIEKISNALNDVFISENLEVFDLKFKEKPASEKRTNPKGGGYKISFKLIEKKPEYNGMSLDKKRIRALHISGTETTFKVDISKHEYCDNKIRKDVDGYTVYVYTPEMIVLEKMRAICQQTKEYQTKENTSRKPRPRDFYDIYMICSKLRIDVEKNDNVEMLGHIFEKKNVPTELLIRIEEDRNYHELGFKELIDTLPPEERNITYNEIFDYVRGKMRAIHQILQDRQDSTV